MKKLFFIATAVLASFSLWAETVTFSASEFKSVKTVTKNGITMTLVSSMSNASEQQVWKDGSTAKKADVVQIANSANADHTAHWVEISSTTKITAMSITAVNNQTDGNVYKIPVVYWKGEVAAAFDGLEIIGLVDKARASAPVAQNLTPIAGAKVARLYRTIRVNADTTSFSGANGYVTIGDGKTAMILSIDVTAEDACTDPEFTISPTEGTGFVGDPINIAVTSKNQSKPINPAVTVDGVPGVYGTDYTFSASTGLVQATPLKAGTFVVTFSQASNGTYCAADESATFVISEKTPVASVTIAGPAAGFIGQELTYTATAVGATEYEWYLDGNKQGSDSAKFIYTAVKGNHNIVCKARNQFNGTGEWIASDAKAVTITKLCGELIKVSATAYNAATATGIFSGTTSASMSSKDSEKSVYEDLTGYKLNTKNTHLGITFNAGQTLQAGDVATVFVTTVSAKLQLFADKGTTLIGETDNVVQGENQIILGSAANGANGIYVYRTEAAGADMNPFVAYVSVTRPCEESDNNNASVTINGEAAEKSGTVFNYTLSASYAESTVAVEITLEHPLATLMEDHAASFTMATPEAGQKSVETFKVKAENGDQAWYSIFVEKSAALSSNADLSALSVAGLTLSPDFAADVTEYTVTKAYEAAMPAVGDVTATPADANAKGAEVTIAGNVITVTVTAENDDTKVYTITVNNAPALKSLSQVKFANGFDAFIDNTNHTVKAFYLAGDAAPEAAAIVAGNGTAGPLSDGKIVVTGADESVVDYAVTLEAVAANTNVVESTADAGTFDGTETWVKSGLYLGNAAGFNEGKYVLRRQLKGSDKADDQRVIAGWVRAYFFVGNASKLELANTANKQVKYAVDGGEYTESEANPLVILLNEGNHMIEVVTNQSSGDCNLSAPKLVKRTPTSINNTDAAVKTVKVIRNGQLIIIRDGKEFNVLGTAVK